MPLEVDTAPEPLQVWTHAPELEAPARAAAARILAATGVLVQVNATGTSDTAVPMFLSEDHGKWIGMCGTDAAWLAIDAKLVTRPDDLATVTLHELLHVLGAQHVPDGAGIMAEDVEGVGDGRLTAADLESVCGVASCTQFVPEG